LHTVGASPWQLGAAVALGVLAVSAPALGLAAGWRRLRSRSEIDEWDDAETDDDGSFFATTRIPRLIVPRADTDTDPADDAEPDSDSDDADTDSDSDDAAEPDHLAG
jgi:hypothetical protein